MKHLKNIIRIIPLTIMTFMIICVIPTYANTFLENTEDGSVTVKNETSYTIIDGVTEGDVTLNRGGTDVKAHVVLVKGNANAKFKPIIPGYYTSGSTKASRMERAKNWTGWSTLGVTDMIGQYNSAADTSSQPVLAAINGDFSNTNLGSAYPRGSVVLDGQELIPNGAADDEFFFGYREGGSLNIVQRNMGQQNTFTDAICGGAYILRNGNIFGVENETVSRQRTGLAIKANGDVILITVDSGITVKQLAELMKASGYWNGINLDGGGSTTLVTRRAGESKTTRRTSNNASGYSDEDANGERKINSALMLVADSTQVNTAYATGNSLTTDKTTYEAGEPIKVTAASIVPGAWVALNKKTEAYNSGAYFWYYTYGSSEAGTWCWANGQTVDLISDGVCNNKDNVSSGPQLQPGTYKVGLLKGDYEIITEKEITITALADDPSIPYSLELNKETYTVGENIEFKATSPKAHTWVAIFDPDDAMNGDPPSYYWYDLLKTDQGAWHYLNVRGSKVTGYQRTAQDGSTHRVGDALRAGHYKAVLFESYDGSGTYTPKVIKNFTVYDPNATYTITYKNGDQTISGLAPATYKYSADTDVSLPSKEVVDNNVEGYTFNGWYTDSELSGDAVTVIPKGSMRDKTIYGKFTKKTFKVTFDSDNGDDITEQSIEYLGKAVKPADPEKNDCYFKGWRVKDTGELFDFETPIRGDTDLQAIWQEKGTFEVSFETYGGSTPAPQFVREGEHAARPESDPIKTGYGFADWYSDEGLTSKYDFSSGVTDNITIYAGWSLIKYSITYNLNGGEAGESYDNPKEYTVETPTFELKAPMREGYDFCGWEDEEGNIIDTIEQGNIGNLNLKAKWEKGNTLVTDKDTYMTDEDIMVTAYCEGQESWVGLFNKDNIGSGQWYYYYYVKQSNAEPEAPFAENGAVFNLLKGTKNGSIKPGEYQIVLFGDGGFDNKLKIKNITIIENPNPAKGTLSLSGWSRDDKKYSGVASGHSKDTMYEYFYGDAIEVTINKTNGSDNAWNSAWVGIVSDDDFAGGNISSCVNDKWVYLSNIPEGVNKVNLNYTKDGELITSGKPDPMLFGVRWAVLGKGSRVIAAVPYHYRTFNMDWFDNSPTSTWTESSRQAAQNNISVELEWENRVANGSNQVPSLVLKRINGHFGFDAQGKEITEETLRQGSIDNGFDYEVKNPSSSSEPGIYSIGIRFPDNSMQKDDMYHYITAKPDYYGFREGITYILKASENDRIINYVLNGGENNKENPSTYRKGEEVNLLAPSKQNCTFEGWYTTSDFKEGTKIEKITADFDKDVTVYAKWASEYTAEFKIKYVLNGGTNDAKNPEGYTGNADIALKPAKKANCTFAGWFFDAEFTKPADVIPKGTKGDLTVYAKFTASEETNFTISTSVIGGIISDNVKVKKGESHTVTYEPNSGYVLKSVTVDGMAEDIRKYPSSYTFENVSASHTIDVEFISKSEAAAASKVKKGKSYTRSSQSYKVTALATSSKNGTVTFTKAKNAKNVTVPATVKLADGRTYKVTRIGPKAFNKSKIRTVTIGKNVKKIDKYAFKSSKATKLIIKSKLLKKAAVKGSLKSSKIKTISVKITKKASRTNKTFVKKYRKYFTKKNAGRKATVK